MRILIVGILVGLLTPCVALAEDRVCTVVTTQLEGAWQFTRRCSFKGSKTGPVKVIKVEDKYRFLTDKPKQAH